jgi:uncharacterized RDD family membrane protein YckC
VTPGHEASSVAPRLAWRRIGAFLVDYSLAYVLTLLLLLPVLDPDQGKLRLSQGLLRFTSCNAVTTLPQAFHDLVAPKQIAEAQVCQTYPFGIRNGATVQILYDVVAQGPGRTYKHLTIATTSDGTPFIPFAPQTTMLYLLLIIASAALLTRKRRTPGKRLFGLAVAGSGCAMCRELRRLGPFLLVGLANLLAPFLIDMTTVPDLTNALPLLLLAGGLITLLFLLYYILPLIRWRGAMPWDRSTGYKVVRHEQS